MVSGCRPAPAKAAAAPDTFFQAPRAAGAGGSIWQVAEVPLSLWWAAVAPLPPPAGAGKPDCAGLGALLRPHPAQLPVPPVPSAPGGHTVTSLCFPGDFVPRGDPIAASLGVAAGARPCPGEGTESLAVGLRLLDTTRSHLLLFLPAKRLYLASPNLAQAPEPRGFLFALLAAAEP